MTSDSPHPIRLYLCFHLLSQWTSSFQLNDHQCIWYKGTLLHATTKWYVMWVIKYCTVHIDLYFKSVSKDFITNLSYDLFSVSPPKLFKYLTTYHNKIQSSTFDSREALKTKNPLTLFSISRTSHFNTLKLQPFISMLLLQGIQSSLWNKSHSVLRSRDGCVIRSNIFAFIRCLVTQCTT